MNPTVDVITFVPFAHSAPMWRRVPLPEYRHERTIFGVPVRLPRIDILWRCLRNSTIHNKKNRINYNWCALIARLIAICGLISRFCQSHNIMSAPDILECLIAFVRTIFIIKLKEKNESKRIYYSCNRRVEVLNRSQYTEWEITWAAHPPFINNTWEPWSHAQHLNISKLNERRSIAREIVIYEIWIGARAAIA